MGKTKESFISWVVLGVPQLPSRLSGAVNHISAPADASHPLCGELDSRVLQGPAIMEQHWIQWVKLILALHLEQPSWAQVLPKGFTPVKP